MADKKDKTLKSFTQFVRDERSKADADKGREILKKVQDKLKDDTGRVKKADGGIVLKQATDDRNGTLNKSVCRGGGAAIKGIKFSGVK